MRQFGGTIGPARYPLFMKDMKNIKSFMSMLPRPVTSCQPGEIGHTYLLHTQWVRDLVSDVAMFTVKLLKKLNNSKSRHVLRVIDYTYTKIHPLLRICDSFFTQMIVVRNLETTGKMPTHIDEDDYINAIISLSDNPIHGGETYYCDVIYENLPK